MATTTSSQDPPPAASTPTPPRRISYEPGLDGLRAVALLAIFVVHADLGLAPGGFLAVSTFFTLSGFLITALLATEHATHDRIDLVAFWRRRVRRLLPASLVAVALIALATLVLGDAGQVARLRGDVVGALAYVANWRFIAAGTTYAGEFSGQSPLLHFWSLAIEEQFYVVFPLLAVPAFALARRWRHAVAAILALGVAASLAAGIAGAAGNATPDTLYFRTDVRAGELLVGALFGLWWVRGGSRIPDLGHRIIQGAGGVLLVVMVALVATSDYRDAGWYRGGLLAYSLVTVGVVLAAVEPAGPVRRLLAWRPLVQIGVVSYGAYLVHWPLFIWLATETSIPGAARLVLGTVVSLALAVASHRLIELPVREQRFLPAPALAGVGAALLVVAVGAAALAPRLALVDEVPLEQAAGELSDYLEVTAAAPGEAPTVGIFGDSTALITTLGLAIFDDEDPTIRVGSGSAGLGCTVTVPGEYVTDGVAIASEPGCDDWLANWELASTFGDLDIALVMFGPWEVKEMRPAGAEDFQVIGDGEHDALVEERLVAGLDALDNAPLVVLATSPYVEPGRTGGRSPERSQPDSDPARMDRVNEILLDVAGRRPGVGVLDLAGWLEESGEDRRLRPDGVHLTDSTALELAPRLAATLARFAAVADGETEPASDDDLFPVLQWARPVEG